MNLIKLIALILGNKVKDAAEWVKNNIDLSVRLLYLSIGLPLLLTVIGLLTAGLSDSPRAIAFGRGLIIVSGLVSSMLLTLFWVRATVLVDIIVYATKGVGLVTNNKVRPLDIDQAERFIQWLRGVTTWITAVWIYVMIVPIWRDLEITAIVLTCIVFFSGVMSSRWFNTPLTKKIAASVVVLVFIFGTVATVSPDLVSGIRELTNSYVGEAAVRKERLEKLNEVQQAARKEATVLDQSLLRSLTDRQQQIKRRALELCGGKFCSQEEAAEYSRLDEDIRRVGDGTYWQRQAAPRPATGAPTVHDDDETGGGSPSTDLPPPLSPRRQAADTGKRLRRHGKNSLDEVFQELEKYPELK